MFGVWFMFHLQGESAFAIYVSVNCRITFAVRKYASAPAPEK